MKALRMIKGKPLLVTGELCNVWWLPVAISRKRVEIPSDMDSAFVRIKYVLHGEQLLRRTQLTDRQSAKWLRDQRSEPVTDLHRPNEW
jgi:hypothetical protein